MALKLRASPPPSTPPSRIIWDDLDGSASSPNDMPHDKPKSMPSPPTSWLEHRQMPMYGARPLEPEVPIVRCLECQRPILASAILEHNKNCEAIKKLEAKNKDASGTKRKAEDDPADGTVPAKKKTKKELAKEASKNKGRTKGPAEYDKHCCVINSKGVPCSRSITCKVHSMVAKRSVVGRSKPYDELLLDWKRANVPGFVEPVKRETKAERKAKKEAEKEAKRQEMLAAGIVPGTKKSKSKSAVDGVGGSTKKSKKDKLAAGGGGASGDKSSKGHKASKLAGGTGYDEDEEDDAFDSEVELESLVNAVRIAKPYTARPLAQPSNMANLFITRNEILRNCTDTMRFALSGSNLRAEMGGTGSAVSLA